MTTKTWVPSFIARPRRLIFVGSPHDVTHYQWEEIQKLTEADIQGRGWFNTESFKTVLAATEEEAADKICRNVGKLVMSHFAKLNPKWFRFNIYISEIKDAEFWPNPTLTNCKEYTPLV